MSPDMMTITLKEYFRLMNRDDLLSALEAGGVDNWEGYWEATKHLYPAEEDGE